MIYRYPEPLSASQQGAGLVAPAAAVALMGRSGAIAMLIVTYMVSDLLFIVPFLTKSIGGDFCCICTIDIRVIDLYL